MSVGKQIKYEHPPIKGVRCRERFGVIVGHRGRSPWLNDWLEVQVQTLEGPKVHMVKVEWVKKVAA